MEHLSHLGSGIKTATVPKEAGHSHFVWPSAVVGAAIDSEDQSLTISTKFATSNYENGPLSPI